MKKKKISIVTMMALVGSMIACGQKEEVQESTNTSEIEQTASSEVAQEDENAEYRERYWYTQKDWPVDSRWDEHTDVDCLQIGDMFFYDGQSWREVADELRNSEMNEFWTSCSGHRLSDDTSTFEDIIDEVEEGEDLKVDGSIFVPMNTGTSYQHFDFKFFFDDNQCLDFDKIVYLWYVKEDTEYYLSFVRHSKDDILIPYDFYEDDLTSALP